MCCRALRAQTVACLAFFALVSTHSMLGAEPSHIYVYADLHAAASSWKPVSCDGTVVAKIKNGSFFALAVTAGRHTCAIADGTPSFLVVESNHDAFLRVDEYVVIGEPRLLILTPVSSELARKEMIWLPYIPGNKILASKVSITDPRSPEEPKFKTRKKPQ